MPKRPDNEVGEPGGPAVGGGRQTPQQAALTSQDGEGRSDAERKKDWAGTSGEPGRPPVALGGNSQGQGDRVPAGGATVSNAPASNPATQPGTRHKTD
jgi:hypothetical protein